MCTFIHAHATFAHAHTRLTIKRHRSSQAKLFNFALYGEGMRACATFPVHFEKDEAGVFKVNKEKQAKVVVACPSRAQSGADT